MTLKHQGIFYYAIHKFARIKDKTCKANKTAKQRTECEKGSYILTAEIRSVCGYTRGFGC